MRQSLLETHFLICKRESSYIKGCEIKEDNLKEATRIALGTIEIVIPLLLPRFLDSWEDLFVQADVHSVTPCPLCLHGTDQGSGTGLRVTETRSSKCIFSSRSENGENRIKSVILV